MHTHTHTHAKTGSVHRVADGALVRLPRASPESAGGSRRGAAPRDREFSQCADRHLVLRVYARGARIHRQCVRTRSSGWWRLFRTLPVRRQHRGIHEAAIGASNYAFVQQSSESSDARNHGNYHARSTCALEAYVLLYENATSEIVPSFTQITNESR